MAAKKKPAKAKAAAKYVTLMALGNQPVRIQLKGDQRTFGTFLKRNIPAGWNVDQFEAHVNNRAVDKDYILNDGDTVTFSPNVAGGQR